DYCGLNIVQSDIDGISFNSILNGNEALGVFQDRTLYYHWQRGYPEAYRNIAVRKGDYKLVGHKGADATIKDFELFNIKNDPYEEHNINFKEPDKTLELKDNFDQWILANLSNNKNYKYQKFIVGSEHERVSHLSRNDARSMPAMWTNDHQYGLWDICIDQTGNYKITIKYREPIEKPGVAIICMAPFQKTINIDHAGVQEVVFDRFYVVKGEYRVESTFITNNGGGEFVAPFLGGGYYSPFTIEIERQ
ncbi:MAG: DUF4976 domain-containing protein, partial [Cyclobacteriaceae bacterium]|nr:DUF4976 domain-containing protein [Cyclobacteriaceae bacterium]